MLERLIQSGMNAARLNFSHGTHESHAAAISAIRQAAERQRVAVAIIQDVQGPRIRVGKLPDGGIEVRAGQSVCVQVVSTRSGDETGPHSPAQSLIPSSVPVIPVVYPALTRDLLPGARILINDGLIELIADRISEESIDCTVVTGGKISSHKGINLPGTDVSAPTLTDKDREDIRFGVSQGVDYVALSFVRGPEDIVVARTWLVKCGGTQPIIAKIERAEAITALDAILEQAEGVMIARGDLGVEMGPEAVPV